MNIGLALGALLLTVIHLGFIFIGVMFLVVSKDRAKHIIGWAFIVAGGLAIFASIYMGLFYQTGMDHL